MGRGLVDAALLFALPFVLYTLALTLGLRYPALRPYWSQGRVTTLTVAGLALALLGMLFFGLLSPRYQGAYRPAHVEGGRIVPGHIE